MPYEAVADVSYYQMEGVWDDVREPVLGGPFDTVEAAQAACAARRGDHIVWTDLGDGHWEGDVNPDEGVVVFRIRPLPVR